MVSKKEAVKRLSGGERRMRAARQASQRRSELRREVAAYKGGRYWEISEGRMGEVREVHEKYKGDVDTYYENVLVPRAIKSYGVDRLATVEELNREGERRAREESSKPQKFKVVDGRRYLTGAGGVIIQSGAPDIGDRREMRDVTGVVGATKVREGESPTQARVRELRRRYGEKAPVKAAAVEKKIISTLQPAKIEGEKYPGYEGPSKPRMLLELRGVQKIGQAKQRKKEFVVGSTLGPVPAGTQKIVGEYVRQSVRGKAVKKPTGEKEIIPTPYGGAMEGMLTPESAAVVGKETLKRRLGRKSYGLDLSGYTVEYTPGKTKEATTYKTVYNVPGIDVDFQTKELAEAAIKREEETEKLRRMGAFGLGPQRSQAQKDITKMQAQTPTAYAGVMTPQLREQLKGQQIASMGPYLGTRQVEVVKEEKINLDDFQVKSRFGEGAKKIPVVGGLIYEFMFEPGAKAMEAKAREFELQKRVEISELGEDITEADKKAIQKKYERKLLKEEQRQEIKVKMEPWGLRYASKPRSALEQLTKPVEEVGLRFWKGDVPLVDVEVAPATMAPLTYTAFGLSAALPAAGMAKAGGTALGVGVKGAIGGTQYLGFAKSAKEVTKLTGSPGLGYVAGAAAAGGIGYGLGKVAGKAFPYKPVKIRSESYRLTKVDAAGKYSTTVGTRIGKVTYKSALSKIPKDVKIISGRPGAITTIMRRPGTSILGRGIPESLKKPVVRLSLTGAGKPIGYGRPLAYQEAVTSFRAETMPGGKISQYGVVARSQIGKVGGKGQKLFTLGFPKKGVGATRVGKIGAYKIRGQVSTSKLLQKTFKKPEIFSARAIKKYVDIKGKGKEYYGFEKGDIILGGRKIKFTEKFLERFIKEQPKTPKVKTVDLGGGMKGMTAEKLQQQTGVLGLASELAKTPKSIAYQVPTSYVIPGFAGTQQLKTLPKSKKKTVVKGFVKSFGKIIPSTAYVSSAKQNIYQLFKPSVKTKTTQAPKVVSTQKYTTGQMLQITPKTKKTVSPKKTTKKVIQQMPKITPKEMGKLDVGIGKITTPLTPIGSGPGPGPLIPFSFGWGGGGGSGSYSKYLKYFERRNPFMKPSKALKLLTGRRKK